MSRAFNLALLVVLAVNAGGCCIFAQPSFDIFHNATAVKNGKGHFRIELSFLPEGRLINEDISPHWDLGRFAAAVGKDRLLIFERTTSYSDLDEKGEPIVGTLRDRKTERLWLTIPIDQTWQRPLKLSEMEEGLIGFEVSNHDNRGFFAGPCVVQGYVVSVQEQCGMLAVDLWIEVRPQRPFAGDDWSLFSKHMIRKSETIRAK